MRHPAFALRLFLPTLLLAFAAAGTPSSAHEPPAHGASAEEPTPTPPAVVAEVNGEPVYLEHLERRLGAMHSGLAATERSAPDLDQLVFRLVNDTLLAQEARIMGMDREDPIPSKLENLRRRMAVSRLEREEIWGPATATDEEVRAAYEEEYRRVTLRVITTHEEDAAEEVRAELEKEGTDFAELARERSVDPYQLKGGLVEDLPKLDLQRDIAAVAFDLEPGEVFGPVRTDIGWSVIQVESFQPADPELFDERLRDVRDMVRFRKAQVRRTELAAELRGEHPVTVDGEVLASIEPQRQQDGRLVPEVPDRAAVLVRIGEAAITAGDFADALKFRWKGIRNEEAARAAVPILLDKQIEERLVQVEALARGYGDGPEVRRELDALETDLLVDRYLEEVVAEQVEIEADEMKAYYEEHLDTFRQPPRFHVSQITVETEEKARELLKMLREGADFAWVAREHSIDRFQASGGERGWVYPMPDGGELAEELLASDVGDVVGPMGVPGNWSVVRVNVRERQDPYPFRQVSGNVRAALFQERFSQVLDRFVQTLRDRSEISVHDEVLATLRISGEPQGNPEEAGAEEPPAGHGG